MWTLIVFYIINGSLQSIQLDGFPTEARCHEAYTSEIEMPLAALTAGVNARVASICLNKQGELK